MNRRSSARWLLCAAVLSLATLPTASRSAPPCPQHRAGVIPPLVFWAWERPESLQGLGPRPVAVAFLATTATLSGDRIVFHRRAQPLHVDAGTPRMAVVRIETDRRDVPRFSTDRTIALARDMASLVRASRAAALQIDFDAVRSERGFYRQLLVATRAALPADVALSITALASWCGWDNWLDDLPIDEAVPMLFRLGRFERDGYRRLGAAGDWRAEACRGAVGLSTDEPLSLARRGRRVYVFRPTAWTPAAAAEVEQEVGKWPH